MLTKRSLAIYPLSCALVLAILGSAHIVAFSLQSSSPSPSIQTIQQGIPGANTAEQQSQLSSSTLPQPPQQQQRTSEGIIARGIINSLIFTPSATWIATGNWTIGVNNGAVALVSTNMTWYNDNGTASHSHEILNFRPIDRTAVPGQGQQQQSILVQPEDNSVSLRGLVDIGANISWNDVQSTIDIKKGGKILAISLNDAQTNNHFGGRHIFGIVTSLIRCSDIPGPNMEMPTPCLNIPIPVTPPSSAAIAPSLATTTAPVSHPSTTIAPNNTIQNPSNFTVSTPPAPPSSSSPSAQPPAPSLSSPSGNIITNRLSPASNATGKSPFDILGGG